jgi:hypothetical protein
MLPLALASGVGVVTAAAVGGCLLLWWLFRMEDRAEAESAKRETRQLGESVDRAIRESIAEAARDANQRSPRAERREGSVYKPSLRTREPSRSKPPPSSVDSPPPAREALGHRGPSSAGAQPDAVEITPTPVAAVAATPPPAVPRPPEPPRATAMPTPPALRAQGRPTSTVRAVPSAGPLAGLAAVLIARIAVKRHRRRR